MTTTANSAQLRSRLWLVVAPTAACGADVVMTLLGQSRTYWSGGFSDIVEFNPLARLLLGLHPSVFIAAACLSSLLVGAIIVWANRPLAVFCSFFVTFCHAVAAASWLLRSGSIAGIAGAIVLLVVAERVLSRTWDRAGPAAPT